MQLILSITTICILLTTFCCLGINFIDVNQIIDESETATEAKTICSITEMIETRVTTQETVTPEYSRAYPPVKSTMDQKRRFMVITPAPIFRQHDHLEDEKDVNLKKKISMLVEQSINDAKIKMRTIDTIKEKYKDDPPYRVGFIFSNLKKSKDVMNELFNVAVKHRHDWKALEQMKIFELIVHTNVDTTNLVRQLVEIHLQHLNSTNPTAFKKRVVLL